MTTTTLATCSAHMSYLAWDQKGFPDVDLPVRIASSTTDGGSPRADLHYEDGSALIFVLGKHGLSVFWSAPETVQEALACSPTFATGGYVAAGEPYVVGQGNSSPYPTLPDLPPYTDGGLIGGNNEGGAA